MKNAFYCLHLHFEAPAGENPWLDELEPEAGAAPYRDRVERLFHECVGPNSAAALLAEDGGVLDLVDNFSRLSFDFCPRLLAWIERFQPRVYERIIRAGRSEGRSLATPYPAMILPLASLRDKRTAVAWGLRDFRRRFGRDAEGLWLPENAADEETLEVLVEAGIRFTLLSAPQGARVRPAGSRDENDWTELVPGALSTTRPYRWRSKKGRGHVDVFFYRPELVPSARVDAAERFANRMIDSLTANDAAQLSHAAPDAEWFGPGRPHGERVLARILDLLEREAPARASTYAAFLDLFPPPEEVDIPALSSRSCPHGVGRWSLECGCEGAGVQWRAPLRAALDWLAAELDGRFDAIGNRLFRSPLEARTEFGDLLFSRSPGETQPFLDAQSRRHPTPEEAKASLRLAEMDLQRMKAFSHWGWRGRDPSDEGPVQALVHAARALDLLGGLNAPDGEKAREGFLARLAKCPCGSRSAADAAEVFRKLAAPLAVDPVRAAAHFAVADHLEHSPSGAASAAPELGGSGTVFEKTLTALVRRTVIVRRRPADLSVSFVSVRRLRTFETARVAAAVLHRGGTDLQCWTAPVEGLERARGIAAELDRAFLRDASLGTEQGPFRAGAYYFTLDALFTEARRAASRDLLVRGGPERREALAGWRRFIARAGRGADPDAVREAARLLRAACAAGAAPDGLPGARILREVISRSMSEFSESPDAGRIPPLIEVLEAAGRAGLHVRLWELRDLAYRGIRRLAGTAGAEQGSGVRRLADLLGLMEKGIANGHEKTQAQ